VGRRSVNVNKTPPQYILQQRVPNTGAAFYKTLRRVLDSHGHRSLRASGVDAAIVRPPKNWARRSWPGETSHIRFVSGVLGAHVCGPSASRVQVTGDLLIAFDIVGYLSQMAFITPVFERRKDAQMVNGVVAHS